MSPGLWLSPEPLLMAFLGSEQKGAMGFWSRGCHQSQPSLFLRSAPGNTRSRDPWDHDGSTGWGVGEQESTGGGGLLK